MCLHVCNVYVYACVYHLVSFRVDLTLQRFYLVMTAKLEVCLDYYICSLEHFHHLKSWLMPTLSSSLFQGPALGNPWTTVDLLCKFASDISYVVFAQKLRSINTRLNLGFSYERTLVVFVLLFGLFFHLTVIPGSVCFPTNIILFVLWLSLSLRAHYHIFFVHSFVGEHLARIHYLDI